MLITITLVFAAVFALTVLLMAAAGAGASERLKLTLSRLDSIMATSTKVAPDDTTMIKQEELLSSIPWFDRWIRSRNVFGNLRLLLMQADVRWTPGRLLLISLACAAAAIVLVYARTLSLPAAFLLGALAACVPWLYVYRKRAKRFGAFEEMLPDALDLIVSALRAGHGLTSAFGAVAKEMADPIAKEFRQCFDEQNFGLELRTAMLNLTARMPIQDMRIIATAVLVQRESGGNLAEVLDKVAAIIRERFRLKRQIRVHTAQGRLTGWVLGCLPVALGIAIYLSNPAAMSVLWTTPLGKKMLYGGLILMTIGGLAIRKIVRVRV